MPKAKLRAATVGGSADDIEATFYEAMQTGDLEKLMGCWADEDDIVCVHPGGPRLVGNAAIRAAFEALFTNGTINVKPEHVCKVESLTSAMHNLVERIVVLTNEGPQQALVLTTNVYQRTPQGWRMVAHHVSPGAVAGAVDALSEPQVLH